MSAEFDSYASEYSALLKDPIRDWFAPDAEFFHWRKWLLLKNFLLHNGASPGHLRWLDVGCGKGELLRLGKSFFADACGCDPSSEMLKGCGDLEIKHQANNGELPYADQSFDLITAVCVYHHMNQGERQFLTKEAFRVLRPGGSFGIFEHNPWNPLTRRIVKRAPVDANAVLLTPSETRFVMVRAGFEPISIQYFLYFPAKLYSLVGWLERVLARVPMGGQYAAFARRHSRL